MKWDKREEEWSEIREKRNEERREKRRGMKREEGEERMEKLKERMKKRKTTLLSHDSYVSSRAIICNT